MTTIFTSRNSGRCASVFDVEAKQRLENVESVDIKAGTVTIIDQPLTVVGGRLVRHKEHYEDIHPIYAGSSRPCLFHCYGRMQRNSDVYAVVEVSKNGETYFVDRRKPDTQPNGEVLMVDPISGAKWSAGGTHLEKWWRV